MGKVYQKRQNYIHNCLKRTFSSWFLIPDSPSFIGLTHMPHGFGPAIRRVLVHICLTQTFTFVLMLILPWHKMNIACCIWGGVHTHTRVAPTQTGNSFPYFGFLVLVIAWVLIFFRFTSTLPSFTKKLFVIIFLLFYFIGTKKNRKKDMVASSVLLTTT